MKCFLNMRLPGKKMVISERDLEIFLIIVQSQSLFSLTCFFVLHNELLKTFIYYSEDISFSENAIPLELKSLNWFPSVLHILPSFYSRTVHDDSALWNILALKMRAWFPNSFESLCLHIIIDLIEQYKSNK